MSLEKRKLPKRTIVLIFALIVLATFIFLSMDTLRNEKFNEILVELGYKDIKNIKVVNRMNAEDTITKEKSYVYKLTFFDNSTNKQCTGFITKTKDKKYTKDFDCK